MEEKKKSKLIWRIIIRVAVLAGVFVGTFFVSTTLMNRNNQGVTSNMEKCTFPTVTVLYKEQQMNRMYGYADPVAAGGIRSSISLLDETHKLSIQVQTFGTKVNGIRYQVRSLDMERLIEETEVTDYTETEELINARLNIQDLLEDNTDYLLTLQLDTEADSDIYYYTRIRRDGEYFAQEDISFVQNFHEKTFRKNSEEELVRYLESSEEGDNSSFHFVNIHSSYDLVTWGSLDILQKEDVNVTLHEINNQTATITLDYMLYMKNSADEMEHYTITEYYRVRYTKDRIYLLDFERTMNQLFEIDNGVIYSTAVNLGITAPDVQYEETKDGKIVCFVQQGELFVYNSSEHTLAKVFGFWENDTDSRYRNNQHDIKIINVDDSGNMDFVIYGYMNRGVHEGKVGISVCHYDSKTNATEEYVFLQSDLSYELLRQEVGELLYVNSEGKFYIYIRGNLYEIDRNTKKINTLAENVTDDKFAVSDDNTLLVLQKQQVLEESDTLLYMNLKTGKNKTIVCGEGERIRPIGFVGTDFIYGVARYADVHKDSGGETVFPMYKVVIENSNGEVKKTYEPAGIYVLQSRLEKNVLYMTRAAGTGDGTFRPVEDDQIIHSAGAGKKSINIKSITTENKKKQYQLNFGFSLPTGKKKSLRPKELLLENVQNIILEPGQEKQNHYYVYAKGKLDNMYIDAAEAVKKADETAGVVVNEKQLYIWERIKRQTSQQIQGLETIAAQNGASSLDACLTSILHYCGSGTSPAPLLEQGMMPMQILQQELDADRVVNLTGAELDKVLYCIDRGYPVLAAVPGGNYVVLAGYNELNTIVMDPVKGNTGYVGMNDSRTMFGNAGNTFIACIPK